jgi:gamma-glutamylcyclotransferase (GGCT)/AIG2-like uncharacterized protein YtfP
MTEPILLFTYGTMRKKCYNNGRIAGSKFIGYAETCEPFIMVAKKYPRQIPYVGRVSSQNIFHGAELPIVGEVYLIDKNTLHRVDRAEGHPYCYERELCHVRMDNGDILPAYIYTYDVEECDYNPVSTGDFLTFYSSKLHKEQNHTQGKFYDPIAVPKSFNLRLPFNERKNGK